MNLNLNRLYESVQTFIEILEDRSDDENEKDTSSSTTSQQNTTTVSLHEENLETKEEKEKKQNRDKGLILSSFTKIKVILL